MKVTALFAALVACSSQLKATNAALLQGRTNDNLQLTAHELATGSGFDSDSEPWNRDIDAAIRRKPEICGKYCGSESEDDGCRCGRIKLCVEQFIADSQTPKPSNDRQSELHLSILQGDLLSCTANESQQDLSDVILMVKKMTDEVPPPKTMEERIRRILSDEPLDLSGRTEFRKMKACEMLQNGAASAQGGLWEAASMCYSAYQKAQVEGGEGNVLCDKFCRNDDDTCRCGRLYNCATKTLTKSRLTEGEFEATKHMTSEELKTRKLEQFTETAKDGFSSSGGCLSRFGPDDLTRMLQVSYLAANINQAVAAVHEKQQKIEEVNSLKPEPQVTSARRASIWRFATSFFRRADTPAADATRKGEQKPVVDVDVQGLKHVCLTLSELPGTNSIWLDRSVGEKLRTALEECKAALEPASEL